MKTEAQKHTEEVAKHYIAVILAAVTATPGITGNKLELYCYGKHAKVNIHDRVGTPGKAYFHALKHLLSAHAIRQDDKGEVVRYYPDDPERYEDPRFEAIGPI